MMQNTDIELANTRAKLHALEHRYQSRLQEKPANLHVHELTLRSLRRLINQLKEEITLLEVHQPVGGRR